jgi:hypothetical protein
MLKNYLHAYSDAFIKMHVFIMMNVTNFFDDYLIV